MQVNVNKAVVMYDPPAFLKAARFRALSIAPYLAAAIGRMPLLSMPGLGTMATDRRGRCYIDLEWARTRTVEDLAAIFAHEVWHILRQHAQRQVSFFSPVMLAQMYADGWNVETLDKASNVAADMEINDGLVVDFERDNKRPLKDGRFPSEIGMADGLLYEQYLAKILETPPQPSGGKQKQQQKQGTQSGGLDWDNIHVGGSSTGGAQRPWELDDSGTAEDGEKKEVPGLSQGEQEIVRMQVAQDIVNHMRQAGKVSADLDLWAKITLAKPEVPWEQLLRSCLRNGIATSKGRGEESYAAMNRKNIALRRVFSRAPIFPGQVAIEPVMAFVVDASGSMGSLSEGTPLWSAVSEVLAVCREQEVAPWVTCVDTEGVLPVQVRNEKDLAKILRGGGGTDMAEGLRLITKAGLRPDFITIVTDGFTPWPTNDEIPRRARLGVVITPGGSTQLEDLPSRAQVIRMKARAGRP